jgi:enoyl-CoA hydratase
MTGDLYGAEQLHEWGVVNRVAGAGELLAAARAFAAQLAAGPTRAHPATKAIVRAQADAGTRGADARTAELTSHLFETDDSREAVESFLRYGPGKANFSGH